MQSSALILTFCSPVHLTPLPFSLLVANNLRRRRVIARLRASPSSSRPSATVLWLSPPFSSIVSCIRWHYDNRMLNGRNIFPRQPPNGVQESDLQSCPRLSGLTVQPTDAGL
ncbi:hypothetical protein F5Y14DRAFT_410100 [Nemania sp. NC0429]|nr:hypothetical protein F5Y14DRAFT_410100 [Nemania sp. NC0429]